MGVTDFTSFTNLVGGELRAGERFTAGTNPSTRQELWRVPLASDQDLEDAITAAKKAFITWSQSPWEERQALLQAAKEILETHKQEMAELLVQEVGKPIQFGHLEVQDALAFIEFNANQPAPAVRVIQDDAELHLSVFRKPLGIVAAICPWNFPLVLAVAKIAAALVTGNCVIVKPSPFTPYSILKFAELVRHVFPAGVLQVLNGDDALGPKLCTHPAVDKISFTGSSTTGKKIMAAAASTLKRLTLELAGNSASIVLPDVDPKIVAPQIAVGSFFNSGQFCMASKRIYVHEDIFDEFLQALVDVVKSWRVAPTSSLERDIMLGPIQNQMQYGVVRGFVQDCIDNGYRFALGGSFQDSGTDFVVGPTIVDNPPDDSLVVKGEPFGPIVPVLKWRDMDDVILRVNDTSTGLGGAVWSKDLDRAKAFAARIEAGTVWINHFEKPLPQAHLAGQKESGFGGEWGVEGLHAYTQPQVLHCYKTPVSK